jgi:uncharacterized protein (DUF924 family)
MTLDSEELLRFWFGDGAESPEAMARRRKQWFVADAAFDDEIAERFADLPDQAMAGALDGWREGARSSLALVLALDQLPRNLYRGTARCFSCDAAGVRAAEAAIDAGFDLALSCDEAAFLYLPFEHAEDLAMQQRCLHLYGGLVARAPLQERTGVEMSLDFARRHHVIIERFGRFPHRNALLGRRSTNDEQAYLGAGGDHF